MKRLTILALSFCVALTITACDEEDILDESNNTTITPPTSSVSEFPPFTSGALIDYTRSISYSGVPYDTALRLESALSADLRHFRSESYADEAGGDSGNYRAVVNTTLYDDAHIHIAYNGDNSSVQMNLSSSCSNKVTEGEFDYIYRIALLGVTGAMSVDTSYSGQLGSEFDAYMQKLLNQKLFLEGECTKGAIWQCVDADKRFAWWAIVDGNGSRAYWERVVSK
jgi:hypothetical protein